MLKLAKWGGHNHFLNTNMFVHIFLPAKLHFKLTPFIIFFIERIQTTKKLQHKIKNSTVPMIWEQPRDLGGASSFHIWCLGRDAHLICGCLWLLLAAGSAPWATEAPGHENRQGRRDNAPPDMRVFGILVGSGRVWSGLVAGGAWTWQRTSH